MAFWLFPIPSLREAVLQRHFISFVAKSSVAALGKLSKVRRPDFCASEKKRLVPMCAGKMIGITRSSIYGFDINQPISIFFAACFSIPANIRFANIRFLSIKTGGVLDVVSAPPAFWVRQDQLGRAMVSSSITIFRLRAAHRSITVESWEGGAVRLRARVPDCLPV